MKRNKGFRQRSILMDNVPFNLYELKIGRWVVVPGQLFMETKDHYVFMNDIRSGIDLGPLKEVKTKHIDPECRVSVFPKSIVDELTKLK